MNLHSALMDDGSTDTVGAFWLWLTKVREYNIIGDNN